MPYDRIAWLRFGLILGEKGDPVACKRRRENPLYLTAGEVAKISSGAAGRKSLWRVSPAVSAIVAPPNSPRREIEESLVLHGRARIVQGGTEGGGRGGLRCNDRYLWALT